MYTVYIYVVLTCTNPLARWDDLAMVWFINGLVSLVVGISFHVQLQTTDILASHVSRLRGWWPALLPLRNQPPVALGGFNL